jgi:predicted RNA-binding protein with PIN domain
VPDCARHYPERVTGQDDAGHWWDRLPPPLRARLSEIAAAAVGGLPAAELAGPLRPLARFAPRKRARVGGPTLLAELAESAAFRSAVLAWWLEHRDDAPGADESLTDAAEAVLADRPDAGERVAEVSERADTATLRSERDAARARVDKLTAELERLRGELAAAREASRGAEVARDEELLRLRTKVREQGSALRAAKDAAEATRRELAELRTITEERLTVAEAAKERARARAVAERARAERAAEAVSDAREAAGLARRADETRLELLVETLSGVATGLRRELALGSSGGGLRPADLVGGAVVRRAASAAVYDEAGLDRLLTLPTVHLVVDGYNVSKTGYPELTLFDQRARLVGGLGVLAARTGAEVTCVFDGAAVSGGPDRMPRGVRVLFSEAGVTADDVIRALVAAEPTGRPVVVVSSDRAVADGVRRDGAHPVPSSVLVARLARG